MRDGLGDVLGEMLYLLVYDFLGVGLGEGVVGLLLLLRGLLFVEWLLWLVVV